MSKPLVIVIAGPTASGKSALGIKVAKKLGGEIISADSRQVYRGMNIGTGKVTKKEMAGIPHHLLDVADPKRTFSVAQYQKLANKKIKEILKRGKTPIIVGGTGFYIQAITDGLVLPEVKPNKKLRGQLAKLTTPELFKKLKKLDPRRAQEIDQHNPHRLIRAIEIATAIGKVPKLKTASPPYHFLTFYLSPSQKQLETNIHKRLIARVKQGMIKEVENLHKQGVSWKKLQSFGLEYQHIARYLRAASEPVSKRVKREQIATMLADLETAIKQYARRQQTWFRNQAGKSGKSWSMLNRI